MKNITVTDTYVEVQAGKCNYRLIPVTAEIIRCITSKKEIAEDTGSLIIEDFVGKGEYPPVKFEVCRDEESVCLKTAGVRVKILLDDGAVFWQHADGSAWARERGRELSETDVFRYTTGDEEPVIHRVKTVDGERNFIKNLKETADRKAYRGRIFFQWEEDEGIYGLGQAEEGIYNYRGHNQYLYQHNMRIPMPMFVSDRGYGVLVDCCSLMVFHDEVSDQKEKEAKDSYLFLDTVDQIDTYFLGGGSMDGIIRGYRYLTGKAQLLPKWAYGYVQSKEQYYTGRELTDVVERYRKEQIPLDLVVQDWNTWEPGNWGEKILDGNRYGDMRACAAQINRMHAHTMVSVWPNMNFGGKNHTQFLEAGYLLNDLSTYNAFDERARRMYWEQAKEGLFDQGFESWWCDSTEPFSGPDWNGEVKREPWERYVLVGNEHKKYLDAAVANAFALQHAKGIYENQRRDCPDKRVLNLTRSGYASGQKYGAMLWSGDTCASWETLCTQIKEGLNMGLSGYPYWTFDIGGFFTVGEKWQNRGCGCSTDASPKWFWQGKYDEGVSDKGYCELYTRWLQVGAFLPMFRSHGTDTPREIWNFGEPGTMFYDAIARFIRLRYHLMPYVYSMAGAVHFEDGTMMRSLLFDFPQDKTAAGITDEFMFGPALLICAVTEPMYYESASRELSRKKSRKCYLPEGCGWYDYWTNRYYEGGQTVEAEAPIDIIPIFVKAGSILPTVRGIQYAGQKPEEPMKICVYPGADAEFTLYEDEGETYGFETGAFVMTTFFWNERLRTLEVKSRKGDYPGWQEAEYTVEICGEQGDIVSCGKKYEK